jgi:hypothetical protein
MNKTMGFQQIVSAENGAPRMNVKSTVQMECKATRHVQQNEVGELYFPARTPIARVLSIIIYYSSLTWPSLGTFGGLGGRPSAQSDLTRAGISRCTGGLLGEFYWAQSWQFDFQTDPRGPHLTSGISRYSA